ncbi:tyrosine-protein phosphatase [Limosilactobacillus sp.]|uniref:tyrosine-protein phosphatase n=1 Tax=Limosilactobacillus sp. TaxID=2773925 RepID=UPI00345E6561
MENKRIIPVRHGYNFRDLGGYETADGHHVQWGRLYRTGRLNILDSDEQQGFIDRHVDRILDLRDNCEVKSEPDPQWDGAQYRHLPVFISDETGANLPWFSSSHDLATDPHLGDQLMKTAYHDMLAKPIGQRAYHNYFANLLADKDGAVVFHCAAGKDRTGVAAYLTLRLLGVSKELAQQDYLLTNDCSVEHRQRRVQEIKAAGGNDITVSNVMQMATAKTEFLQAALDVIRREAGSVEGYFKDVLGFSDNDIADLKRLYLA